MAFNGLVRRQFLKNAATWAAGIAVGARESMASGQSPGAAESLTGNVHNEVPELPRVTSQYSIAHMKNCTPLQDYAGIITPSRVHFVQQHTGSYPRLDADKHRLTIHGLVDRPLSFSLDDLKSLPSVARIHFLECQGNSYPAHHINYAARGASDPDMGLPIQFIHGGTSCSEWSGVPFSVLLNEAGLQKEGKWLLLESADGCKFSHVLPVGKALDDSFVAYGQNGDALRIENGYPIRALVPGWEAPYSVKYLRHIKVTDEPYHSYDGSLNHSSVRDSLGGKARWNQSQWGPKSVITRPSGGMQVQKGRYVQITGLAWSGGGKVAKVEVSTDGGKSWTDPTIQGPVYSKAHTRFVYDWVWEGQAATIQSGCTDETGDVQPSVAELGEHWGIKSIADWQHRPRLFHMNAIQPWAIASDGSISDAMFV